MTIIHTFDIDKHFRALCFSIKACQIFRCKLIELPMLDGKYEYIHIPYVFQGDKAVA